MANNDQSKSVDKEAEPIKESAKAEQKPAKAVKMPAFYVPKGRAITTARGILSDDQEITAEDLPGGKKAIEDFVKTGHVAKG